MKFSGHIAQSIRRWIINKASLKYILKKYLKDGPCNGLVLVVYSRSIDGVMRIFFKQFVRFLKIARVDAARINSRKLQDQT